MLMASVASGPSLRPPCRAALPLAFAVAFSACGITGSPDATGSAVGPTASGAPWPSPSPRGAGVRISGVRSPVARGGLGQVIVVTRPRTPCTISVAYSDGPSRAAGLEPRLSDDDGILVWSWTVGASTTVGEWPIEVRCGGISAKTVFVVR